MANSSYSSESKLLSLPAELRTHIFSFVLADVRCRRPLLIWNDVCVITTSKDPPKATAILLACRTTYEDSISTLYNETAVEISIRSELQDEGFPRFHESLGPIDGCMVLRRLRHVELEVAYKTDRESVTRAAARIRRLANVFKQVGKMKTIDLVFFDRGPKVMIIFSNQQGAGERLLDASMGLDCERFLGVGRNVAAVKNMSVEKWEALKVKAGVVDEGPEKWREVSFDTFEHAFRQKN